MESETALPYLPSPPLGQGWLDKLETRPFLWAGFAISAGLAAAAVGLGAAPSLAGPLGPASPLVLTLLGINFVVILGLGGLMAWRVVRLAREQTGDAGARLHLRFVALFAAAAFFPALIVAFFFGILVTRGVDSWFKPWVETVVEGSAKVADSYIEEQNSDLSEHIRRMARDLNHAGPSALAESPVAFSQFLADAAADNGFPAAYVLDGEGRVLARAEQPDAPTFLDPADRGVPRRRGQWR